MEQTNNKIEEILDGFDGMSGTKKELKDFLSSSLASAWEKGRADNIEHCSEPDCPECNLVAYEKGRQSILDELEEEQKKFLQGFAYKTNE